MTAPLGPPLLLGNPAVQHSARSLRLMLASLFRPTGAAGVAAFSGILPGGPGAEGELTLLSPTLLRVNPGTFLVQGGQAADQGTYVVPNTTARDLALPGRDGSQYRRCLVVCEVLDSQAMGVPPDAGNDFAQLRIVQGPLSGSAVPPLPAMEQPTYLALGEVAVPPTSATGAAVTISPYLFSAALRGGIHVIPFAEGDAPRHRGQYRDHPTRGLQRGVAAGGLWETVEPRTSHLGSDVGADGTATTDRAIINMDITVPVDLPPGRRIRYSGDVYVETGADVNPKVSFHGGRAARTLPVIGSFKGDIHIEYFDNDLTPGYRQVQLRLDAVGGTARYCVPRLHATIV